MQITARISIAHGRSWPLADARVGNFRGSFRGDVPLRAYNVRDVPHAPGSVPSTKHMLDASATIRQQHISRH